MKIFKASPFVQHHHIDVTYPNVIDRFFIRTKYNRSSFNQRMFDEDFARIFYAAHRRSEFLFEIETNNDELAKKLFVYMKTRYRSQRVDRIVHALVEEIAQSLVKFRVAYYFISNSFEESDFSISQLNVNGVFHFLNVYFQLVPARCINDWESEIKKFPRELRILDKNKIMRFDMPKEIEKMLSEQNRVLSILDKKHLTENWFYHKATHENPNPEQFFDFRVWNSIQESVLYRATVKTGWNGRKTYSSKNSEFFDCNRLIRFRRNQLILRDHILLALSHELTRIGYQYDTKFHVKISPTDILLKVSDLDDLAYRLSREEVSFTEVIDFCYKR